ncbi:glycosyltransferase, partial [Bacteroidota bacterium]
MLSNADCVVTVSDTIAKELKDLGAKHTEVITNGYDIDDIPEEKPELDKKFSIVHLGSINKDRNHPVLIQVLKELIINNEDFKNDFEFKLIGKVDHSLINDIEIAGLSSNLNYIEYISHDMVMHELMKARLLYLPINNTPNAKGIVTGKFFEYLASKRPILTIGPTEGDISKILEKTKSGEVFD